MTTTQATAVSTATTTSLSKRRPHIVTQESAEISPAVDLTPKRLFSGSTITEEPPVDELGELEGEISGWRATFERYFELGVTDDKTDELLNTPSSDGEEGLDRIIRSTLKLERLLWFGVTVCLDQVLTCLTTLPFRISYSAITTRRISARLIFDIACFTIVILAVGFLMSFVGAAQVYHSIRLQTFMKLYVVVNIAEVLDRLLSSLGLDLFELLADASVNRRKASSFAVRYILCLAYTCLHAVLFYVRLLTLSVAVNSSNDALFTILVSNNFVELKGSVFKRSTEQNLFQISCSDVVERFVLIVFMFLIGVKEYDTRKMSFGEQGDFFALMGLILVVEIIVDWIKHMFIVRFNSDIKVKDVYDRYLSVLADDYSGKAPVDDFRTANIFPAVARRLGLPIIPLTVVIVRVFVFDVSDLLHKNSWTYIVGGWVSCVVAKLVLRLVLLSWSSNIADASMILLTDEDKTPPVTPRTPTGAPTHFNLSATIPTISAEKGPMSNGSAKSDPMLSTSAAKSLPKSNNKKTPQRTLSKVSRFENG